MASYVQAVMRLFGFGRRRPSARPGEEQGAASSALPPGNVNRTSQRIASDDALTLFRLTLGIATPSHLGFTESAARPLTTSKAEDSYKVFSAVINTCYFLQIIVTAALTALGAASADNKAITAFGAINTIIAGFLTFLKGSGYPARLKYYANEWKKVREFIEQRERDFTLEGCTLDVYEVVDAVREMYDSTKREIEMNTPDSYNSKTNNSRFEGKLRSHLPGGLEAKAEEAVGRLRGLDDMARKLRSNVGSVSEDVEAKSVDFVARLRSVEDTLEQIKSRIEKGAQDAARSAADTATHAVQDEEKRVAAELRDLGKAVVSEAEQHRPRPPREVSITFSHHGDQPDEAHVSVRS
ncbi:uncharacterized protein THITE_120898 [Thermothielavioides terrestris NRRL 8126]|uniref:SMODS and SLOG-associating 2TM effector domain-containing protein n=1 Tax=Thermothielavioides terrestris (strain ATCC 38088 / NRRL 8126) TaxID=578455 RepID=G2QW87_THETT|nr:uncharacterized protein THITE_120898 [Thermothielavioides terrestris NRRL 8126]AEO63062.1 hypothetical protein THITE_120898 [Thermothielavioides terrestris NRRL 8126]